MEVDVGSVAMVVSRVESRDWRENLPFHTDQLQIAAKVSCIEP